VIPILPVWAEATPETYRRLGQIVDPERKLLDALERIVPLGGKRVADIGTGIGHYPILLARRTGRTYGIEHDPELRAEAQRRASAVHQPNLRIVEGRPDALPLRDGAVDVVLTGRLEPHDGSLPALAEALRVLRRGGRLVAVAPYGRDEASRLIEPEVVEQLVAASRPREGWWSRHSFKIKVVHTRIDLRDESLAHELLPRLFGDRGRAYLMAAHGRSLELKVALYHRRKDAAGRD
jgi:SAM-dependent methyltransferase